VAPGNRIRKELDDRRETAFGVAQQTADAIAVLQVSAMDDDVQQQAEGVDDDVPLAAGDLLARVIALRVDPPLWNGPPLSSILFGLVNGEVKGHEVRLMSPEYVRPYVKAQKNDDRDAEAIAEAATRPTMRFVALKTEAQLDVQVLHRVRDRLVGQRTSLMNQIRSILLERGVVVAQGRRKLLDTLAALSSEPNDGAVGVRVRLSWMTCSSSGVPSMHGLLLSTTSSLRWPAPIRWLAAWRPSPASAY
jgi:hypothetical protein